MMEMECRTEDDEGRREEEVAGGEGAIEQHGMADQKRTGHRHPGKLQYNS